MKDGPLDNHDKQRCYGCFRPRGDCFCSTIPVVNNKTSVLIVQHRRERFHPFNTARLVGKSLVNSRVLTGHIRQLAAQLSFKPGAGLLYPTPDARLISELRADQRPEQLVILDGTWHHAKTLLRELPALQRLPRYRLAPTAPSRYRIRREPTFLSLSTIEATLAALHVLEPDTQGFDQLMQVFLAMVEHQLAYPKTELGWRRHERRQRTYRNIPRLLLGSLDQIVVAYGEAAPLEPDNERSPRLPIYWVAERLGTGERFECAIQSSVPMSDRFLGHLELTETHFREARTLDEARTAWGAFRRRGDILAVYNSGVARLQGHLGELADPCLVLKSIDFNPQQHYQTLDELIEGEGLVVPPARHRGRAGKRLASAATLVRHLHALGMSAACGD